jgi:hypothetical protein
MKKDIDYSFFFYLVLFVVFVFILYFFIYKQDNFLILKPTSNQIQTYAMKYIVNPIIILQQFGPSIINIYSNRALSLSTNTIVISSPNPKNGILPVLKIDYTNSNILIEIVNTIPSNLTYFIIRVDNLLFYVSVDKIVSTRNANMSGQNVTLNTYNLIIICIEESICADLNTCTITNRTGILGKIVASNNSITNTIMDNYSDIINLQNNINLYFPTLTRDYNNLYSKTKTDIMNVSIAIDKSSTSVAILTNSVNQFKTDLSQLNNYIINLKYQNMVDIMNSSIIPKLQMAVDFYTQILLVDTTRPNIIPQLSELKTFGNNYVDYINASSQILNYVKNSDLYKKSNDTLNQSDNIINNNTLLLLSIQDSEIRNFYSNIISQISNISNNVRDSINSINSTIDIYNSLISSIQNNMLNLENLSKNFNKYIYTGSTKMLNDNYVNNIMLIPFPKLNATISDNVAALKQNLSNITKMRDSTLKLIDLQNNVVKVQTVIDDLIKNNQTPYNKETGSSWAINNNYFFGQVVNYRIGKANYICILEHYSSLSNAPTPLNNNYWIQTNSYGFANVLPGQIVHLNGLFLINNTTNVIDQFNVISLSRTNDPWRSINVDDAFIAIRRNDKGIVECLSNDGLNCIIKPDEKTCNALILNPPSQTVQCTSKYTLNKEKDSTFWCNTGRALYNINN